MRYVPGTKSVSRWRQGLLIFAIIVLGVAVGVVAEWPTLQKRWTAWRTEVNRVPTFDELPPERQQKALEDPNVWFLKYRLAIQAGELKVKNISQLSPEMNSLPQTGSEFSMGNRYSVLDVDRSEIAPIKEWVRENVPASKAPIFLSLYVRQPQLGDKVVNSRTYKIDNRSVVEQLTADSQGLNARLIRALDDGEIVLSSHPTIGAMRDRKDTYGIIEDVGDESASLIDWVRRNLPEDQPRVVLDFFKMRRSFEITKDGVKEIEDAVP